MPEIYLILYPTILLPIWSAKVFSQEIFVILYFAREPLKMCTVNILKYFLSLILAELRLSVPRQQSVGTLVHNSPSALCIIGLTEYLSNRTIYMSTQGILKNTYMHDWTHSFMQGSSSWLKFLFTRSMHFPKIVQQSRKENQSVKMCTLIYRESCRN